MGSHNFLEPLESVINVILTVIEPHQEDWNTRFQVIEELRNVVVSVESLRGCLSPCFSLSLPPLAILTNLLN